MIVGSAVFWYVFFEVIKMNLSKFIESHKELNELPFLVVYRTISVLMNMGMLKFSEGISGMDKA